MDRREKAKRLIVVLKIATGKSKEVLIKRFFNQILHNFSALALRKGCGSFATTPQTLVVQSPI